MAKLNPTQLAEKIESNKYIYEEYFSPDYARNYAENLFSLLDDVYFRTRFIGFDKLPEANNPERPLIFVSNHSGMAFPWDAIMFLSILWKKKGYDKAKIFRTLTAPALSQTVLMNPFLIPNIWKRAGGLDATFLNFETAMQFNESNLFLYPEGLGGIGKGFNNKYQLQRMATSFIRMSLKYKTDVVPFATVNAEYVNPHSYSFTFINKQISKIGIPFLPLGWITFVLIFQPWLFYFAFPARLTYVLGDRIRPYDMTDKSYEELTDEEITAIRDKVQAQIQANLDKGVQLYGEKPYDIKSLWTAIRQNIKVAPFLLPFFWPFLFNEHERQWKKGNGKDIQLDLSWKGFIRMFIMNPFCFFFFIPILGWIPIAIKGFRKPK